MSLRDTTFVVVDLETTGGRATSDGDDFDAITEIGAVKVRGGEVLGELATLVDPGRTIPPQIVALTGITTAMVCNAPTIDTVLPAFLEFARGAVLVAHNAGFDIGFLRAAAERCEIAWPRPPVLCTVRLARRVLTRDEAPSVRLSALAQLFGAATTPTHRALDDARATVDVLHALIERVGNQGVHTYTDLRSYLPDVTPAQRRKRVLAAHLPHRPGVYLFRGPADEVLYVGTAVDLRRRVSQYFNGTDPQATDEGDGGARHRPSTTSSAHTTSRQACASCGCWPRTPRRTTAVEVPAPVVVDRADRRGVPAVLDRPPTESTTAPSDRSASRADAVETAALLARFTGMRTCTTRIGAFGASTGPPAPSASCRPARRRATSPPPSTRRRRGARRP